MIRPLAAVAAGALVALGLLAVVAVLVARERSTRARRVALPDEPDRDAFRALRAVGADTARPTEVSYFLYFPNLRAAECAGAQVAALRIDAPRLAVRIERAPLGASWLCLVTMRAVPSERAIHAACEELREMAEEYGGELDGWEVAVTW